MLQSYALPKIGGKYDFVPESNEVLLYIDYGAYLTFREYIVDNKLYHSQHRYITDTVIHIQDAKRYKRFVFLVSEKQDIAKLYNVLQDIAKHISHKGAHNKVFIF